jgi:fermentation-respiration switch protein FrsA (DUF1100 family)
MKKTAFLSVAVSAIVLSGCLGGGGGGSDDPVACPTAGTSPSGSTPQQQRIDNCAFSVDTAQVNDFEALPGYPDTERWVGVNEGAGFRIEVPSQWNGQLVMWAHGFRGEGSALTVDNPPMREKMLELGYAWAASSYSANYYDVQAGAVDTNKLALQFEAITGKSQPDKYLIAGFSMGGHVVGAMIEEDNKAILAQTNLDVPYAAAMPMCGVMGATSLFDYFGGYNLALLQLSDTPATTFPIDDADAKLVDAREVLWTDYDANKSALGLTQRGQALFPILQNLTGGERPVFQFTFGEYQDLLQGFAGSDGTVDGILNDIGVDTRYIRYRFASPQLEPNMPEDPYTAGLTNEEAGFNAVIQQATPDSGANAPSANELAPVPEINGEFNIPVLTLHGLGDLFVPISMQQIYRKRAEANGSGDFLVQRAIRDPGHCEFTTAEINEAFVDLVAWEQDLVNAKPGGDDLLDPQAMSEASFGCAYTRSDRLVQFGLPTCSSFVQ